MYFSALSATHGIHIVLLFFQLSKNTMEHGVATSIYLRYANILAHDDVIKWKHFPRYWPFVRGIHRSPANSPDKGQWRGALIFSLICAWINGWVNNREAGELRRHRAHYDAIVIYNACGLHWFVFCCGLYLSILYPCPSGLLHPHLDNYTIAPVPATQPRKIWVDGFMSPVRIDVINTKWTQKRAISHNTAAAAVATAAAAAAATTTVSA